MFTASQLVPSGLGVSALGCFFGRRIGRAVFLSVGMLMLFQAWLQFINVDGSWPWNQRTRPVKLSITHKFGRDGSTQFDVSKARQSTPHDGISGRRIVGPGEIAAEPSDLVEVVRERSPPGLLLRHVLHEMIEQADLGLGQRESRWCIRV